MLDLYCERIAPGLFAEPLNATSNLAFLLAAAWAWRRAATAPDQRLLAILLATIGVGSALFHTLATPLAELCDVIPIALFQVLYLALYLRRAMALSVQTVALAVLLFVGALAFASTVSAWNGSPGYAPPALVLYVLGFMHWRRHATAGLLLTAGLFTLSLVLRSVDLALCARWPLGTHFLWHLVNALVLYRLLNAYREAAPSRA